jgi:hypothetical protein
MSSLSGSVGKGVFPSRGIRTEYPDLAVRNLALRTRILPSHIAGGPTFLQKSGLINEQHAIVSVQTPNHMIPDDITKGIGIPSATTRKSLLPSLAHIACGFRLYLSRLVWFIANQNIKKSTDGT